MTIEPSERAREAAATAWVQWRGKSHVEDEIAAIYEGRNDGHSLAQAFACFEAETLERAAKVAEDELVDIFEDSPEVDTTCNAVVREIAAAIRAMKGQG